MANCVRQVGAKVGAIGVAVLLLGAAVHADVVPGDKITDQNLDKVKSLVSPGMEWCIQHGFPLTIVAPRRIEWPTAYREATEKYSGQVKLAEDGLSVKNFVAGQPFPNVDAKDPQIALKIMWNYEYKFNPTDDLDLRNFDADTGAIANHGPMSVERHFLLDHLRSQFWTGRLFVDPKPEKPNPNGYRSQLGLYPILEPFDLKGVGALGNRYISSEKQDDSWLYLPSLRRVRRLSTAQRSDALFGQDTDVDSYAGYAGQIAWMDWRLLGAQPVLAPFHTTHFPVKWADGAADWAFDGEWEKRDVWVVEGVSKLPQYAYSKRVLYVDKEIFVIAYSDMYDHGGELWKIWINNWRFAYEAFPGSPRYEEITPFIPSIVMVDMQLEHATRVSTPSHRFPGEPGWYWHQGEQSGTTEEEFTIAELIASGR